MIKPTRAQVITARRIVAQAHADGRTPNPATVAIAEYRLDDLNRFAEALAAQAEPKPKPKRRRRKPAQVAQDA